MKRFLPALLVLLPLIAAASPENPAPAVEFLAALHEKDQLKRAEMLLAAAESGVYPADLALIHLTRTAVGTQHGARLRKLAGRRRGELIPAVLCCRSAAHADRELFELGLAALHSAAKKKLSAFEAPLFRELAASLTAQGCGMGEYAELRALFEELIRKDPEWRSKLPVSALVEFYVSCAFATEGFELPQAEWRQSPSELRQSCIRLLDELPKMLPDDAEESGRLVGFFLRTEARSQAAAVALAYGRKHPNTALPLLVMTAVETGEVKLVDSLKKFINPQMFSDFRIRALGNSGAFAEAFEALSGLGDHVRRQALYLDLVQKQGDPALKAKLARDPGSSLPPRTRVLWLLDAAERRNDRECFRDAEKLVTPELDKDPVLANALGYVALLQGIDPQTAEARIDRALGSDPYNCAYLDSKAYARYAAHDYPGAWEWMRKALKAIDPMPSVAEILEHAGDIRLALGDKAQARKFYRTALKLADGREKQPGAEAFAILRKRIAEKLEKLK